MGFIKSIFLNVIIYICGDNMKNKLVLFDWGNIVESHSEGFTNLKAWDDVFGLCGYTGTHDELYSVIVKYRLSAIPNEDKMNEVYEQIKNELNLHTSYEEFKSIYYEVMDKIDYFKDVSEYEKSLKNRCKIGIFSNLLIFDEVRLDKQVDLSQYDYVFLSFNLGYRKPDKEIYEKVQEQLPFDKKNILFIDDKEANIIVAKEFGWNAVQCTGLELDKMKKVIDEFLED